MLRIIKMFSIKFGTQTLRKTVSAGTIKNSGGTGAKGFLNQLKRERPKKIIDHLGGEGKHIKSKLTESHLYKRPFKADAKSDRLICFSILLLIAMAGFIYLAAVRSSKDRFMKSPYFVEINNQVYGIQEEISNSNNFKMSAAAILTIRPREMPISNSKALQGTNTTSQALLTSLAKTIFDQASSQTDGLLSWLSFQVLHTYRNEMLIKLTPKDKDKYLGFFADDEN
jgi:hypothetical protein